MTTAAARGASAPRGLGLGRLPYARRIGLVVGFGALLRLVLLARQPLGFDEDFTAAVVHRPLGDMLAALSRDSSPPLFYLAERLVSPAGAPAWTLRLVPALAGIALIPLVAALARRVGGDRAALSAAALVAVLPAAFLSSENARMYALAGALVVAAGLLLWRAIEAPSPGRWVAWTLAAAAALWTDYFAILGLAGFLAGAVWLRPPRRSLAAACLGAIVAAASLAPWLLYARAQLEHGAASFWVPPLSVESVAGTLGGLVAGPLAGESVNVTLVLMLVVLQWLAVAAAALPVAGLVLAARRREPPGAWVDARSAGFCLLAGTVGAAGLLVASLVWRPLFEARYLSVAWLPLLALGGVGLARLPRAVAVAALACLTAASLALGVVTTHPDTASLLPEIESQIRGPDLVVATPSRYFALLDGGSPALRDRLHVVSPGDVPWYFGTAAYPPGAVLHAIPDEVPAGRGRVFFVGAPADRLSFPLPGYHRIARMCPVAVCLTVFAPSA